MITNGIKKALIKWPQGIRKWMLNSVLAVILTVVICVVGVSFGFYSGFYTSMRAGLEAKAKTATDFFANYITKTYAEFYDSAYKYIDKFEDANTIELQFINSNGRIEISSYGIASGAYPSTPDIENAVKLGEISCWIGKNPSTGEKIMAVSSPMTFSDNQIIGVMRYVTSTKAADHIILLRVLAAAGIGLIAIGLIVVSNLYFVKAVFTPVNEITVTAQKIADGSYGVQIPTKYVDEIGTMVNAINDMSMKISQADKAQTEFISSVSHELRTPLTAITGWGETLIYDDTLNDETRKGIGIILKEARRLTKMVEELLDFTRMQDGRFTLNVETIDVGAELEDSIFTYRELLRQDEIQLEYDPYMDELPLISGDPERLRQVFLNLLDNAAKYGKAGKKIVVSINADNSFVYLNIRDFGPGIPEDELENVKMKFYKAGSKERGSGIGLAVCDEIVNYHGGELILKNADGGGLLVTVKLPIDSEI